MLPVNFYIRMGAYLENFRNTETVDNVLTIVRLSNWSNLSNFLFDLEQKLSVRVAFVFLEPGPIFSKFTWYHSWRLRAQLR